MTNYRAYLYEGPSRKGPSKKDLKLKRAIASGDGKKIANALSEMLRTEDILWALYSHPWNQANATMFYTS